MPQCIGELTFEQSRRREQVTRLVLQGDRVVGTDVLRGALGFYFASPKVVSIRLVYDGNSVVERVGMDRNGLVRRREIIGTQSIRWLDSVGRPQPDDESRVSGAEQTLDDQGRVVSSSYVDATGAPATLGNGVDTVRYAYGSSGLVQEESYFLRNGMPQQNDKGVHRVAIEFDATGLERARHYLDSLGRSAPRKDGVQTTLHRYDVFGNAVEVRDFDAANQPHDSEDKSATTRLKYDQLGNEIETAFFDQNGAPTMTSYGYFTRRTRWNEVGLAIEWRFFDGEGQPSRVHGTDHSIRRRVVDARGRPSHESSFDPEGKAFTLGGAQQSDFIYDERDNLVKRTYLTDTGAPTKAEGRYYSVFRQTFDVDRLTRKENLSENGRLFPIDGKAGYVVTYDALGVATKTPLNGEGLPIGPNERATTLARSD